MKKGIISLLTIVFAFAFICIPAFSQTPTESAAEATDPEVDKLKEKVAEKVEELKEEYKKAVSGTIENIEKNKISLVNPDGETIDIEVDETLTSLYEIKGTKTVDLTLDDLQKGDYIFVSGPEIGQMITANEIYKDTQYIVLSGKITEVNADDYTLKIVTVDKTNYVLDIETSTKQNLLNITSLDTEKIGFTKLKEGDSIHVVVEGNPENPKQARFTARKLLVIPNEYFLQ